MRIALISLYGVRCGIATYSEHLAQELAKEHEVVVFAEDYLKNSQPDHESNLKVIRCFNRDHPDNRLLDALQTYRPDVIHIQHEYQIFKNLELMHQISRKYRGRTVITLHTVRRDEFDLNGFADYFVVHKESCKRHLVERDRVDDHRVEVIPHGTLIFPQIPPRTARLKLGLPLDRKIILSHGFFQRRKNIHKIIEAVAELRNELPIYYIHVGGLHPLITNDHLYFNECQQLIDNLGVGSKVKMVPEFIQDDELAVYMNSADAIVTLEDNNSNLSASGIMHTVAPGKPVIASDVENFDDFPEGTFYKVNLEEKLSPALKEVLTNPELSEELSSNLLTYAETTSWPKIAQKHHELYRKCVQAVIVH